MPKDPYVEICRRFDQAAVRYVVVGVYGINLYAERAGTVITTIDCDFLLPPEAPVLTRAVRALRRSHYELQAGGEPLVGEHPADIAGIIRARANIRAIRSGAQIDLALQIAGYGFQTLWKRHRRFRIRGVTVRVAPLEALIRSKQLADRPKDRLFLETYRFALEELQAAWRKRRRR